MGPVGRGSARPILQPKSTKGKDENIMKRISAIIGLCLAAVVAFSMVASATASATPPTLLLKPTSGAFPATFTSKSVGSLTVRTANGNTIICKKVANKGTLENAHLGKVTIIFEECEITILGHKGPCGNISKTSIELANAVFHFGSALKTKKEEASAVPGLLDLLPGGSFSFKCTEVPIIGEMTIKITGEGVVGLLLTTAGATPVVNTKYAALNLVYEEEAGKLGVQKHTEFLLPLESNKLMSGIQLDSENSFEKKLENFAVIGTDTLEGFKNAEGEATEIEIEEG
jgi:hypothetical protein